MDELWQLYNEQGIALAGKGNTKDTVFSQGLLHGAAHVWIWRRKNSTPEIMLQKRAASKRTWPGLYDISAAGHIDLGEEPLATALREAKEEINLDIAQNELRLFGIHRAYLAAGDNAIENEFQWLYSLELASEASFNLQASEVDSLMWIPTRQLEAECMNGQFVPHTKLYYDTVVDAIELAANAV